MKDTALILIAITPRTAADAERLERALHIMMAEDPTLTAPGAGGDTILGAVDDGARVFRHCRRRTPARRL